MLLTIHNLPGSTRYADIKSLLQLKCGIQQVILDNLTAEGNGKRVTVGVAEEEDAAILVRKINGLYMDGQQLYVEDIRQKKTASEQPFRSANQQKFTAATEQSYQSNQPQYGYQNQSQQAMGAGSIASAAQPFIGGLFYVPYTDSYGQGQNTGQSGQSPGQSSLTYGQSGQKYEQSIQTYGQSSQSYEQSGQSYGQSGQSYGQSGQSYGQSSQNYMQTTQKVQNSYLGVGSFAPQNQGAIKPLLGIRPLMNKTGFPQPKNQNFDKWGNQIDEDAYEDRNETTFPQPKSQRFDKWGNQIHEDEYVDRNQANFPQPKSQCFDKWGNKIDADDFDNRNKTNFSQPKAQRFDKWGNEIFEEDYEASYEDTEKPIFGRRGQSPQSSRPDWTPNQDRRCNTPPRDLSRGNRGLSRDQLDQPWMQTRSDSRGRPERKDFRNDLTVRSNDRGRPRPNFQPNTQESNERSQFIRSERSEFGRSERTEFDRERPEFGRSNEREFVRERPSRSVVRGDQRKRKFDETDQSGREMERPQRISRPETWRARPEAPKQFRPNEVYETGPKKFAGKSNPTFLTRPNIAGFKGPNNAPSKGPKNAAFKGPNNVPFKGPNNPPNKPIGTLSFDLGKKTKNRYYEKCRSYGVFKILSDIKINLGITNTDEITKEVFVKYISERVDALFGENKTTATKDEILEMYRAVYCKEDDAAAYNIVLARVAARKAAEGQKTDQAAKPKSGAKPVAKPAVTKPAVAPAAPKPAVTKPAVATPTDVKPTDIKPAEARPIQNPIPNPANAQKKPLYQDQKPVATNARVPNFPGGEKKNLANHKKDERQGNVPVVAPKQKTALEEEIDLLIKKIFVKEFDNPGDEHTKKAYDSVYREELFAEIRSLLNLNLSRRVSKAGLKVVRIYGTPKLPPRIKLEQFLKPYGVVSLRKSEKTKMFTAAVDSFDAYDRLCAMESTIIDFMTVHFKPFHLTIKTRADQSQLRVQRKRLVNDMIEKTGIDLLSKDWPEKLSAYTAIQAAAAEALKAKEIAKKEQEEKRKELDKEELDNVKVEVVPEKNPDKCEENPAVGDNSVEKSTVGDKSDVYPEKGDESAGNADKGEDNANIVQGESNEYAKGEEIEENLATENSTEVIPDSKLGNNYLDEDFKVIDEVHDSDSDVECLDKTAVIVNLDDDNDDCLNNAGANDANGENDGNDEFDCDLDGDNIEEHENIDIDDVDIDIDDVNDDDLEDY